MMVVVQDLKMVIHYLQELLRVWKMGKLLKLED